jgi:hypothetical protein
MLIEEVAKLTPMERLLYWITERHDIHLKKSTGKPKPWTNDKVMQSTFFTNPYRENDKTTVWFRKNVRNPLKNDPSVLMATVIFRWFNYIPTGEVLWNYGKDQEGTCDLLTRWNEKLAVQLLRQQQKKHGKVFTGAYMIKAGNGPPGCKIPNVCRSISNVWAERKRLVQVCKDDCRLQALWDELCKFDNLGGFMAYEIVCDLRYTYLLSNASDVSTWTNLGPGANRGLARVLGEKMPVNKVGKMIPNIRPDRVEQVHKLLLMIRKKLPSMPRFEMREIEHSLCEFDKMERARLGDGRLKRKYK